jgi:hypothetical protein
LEDEAKKIVLRGFVICDRKDVFDKIWKEPNTARWELRVTSRELIIIANSNGFYAYCQDCWERLEGPC